MYCTMIFLIIRKFPPYLSSVSCKISKSKILPFPLHASKASHCFDLIHSDVLGPSQLIHMKNLIYYVTFKSKVFHMFTKFLTYVASQFSASITTLCTDSGGEYLSNEFQAFLASNYIVH